MDEKGGGDLVSSGVILRDFAVANSTLYRLVKEGRIPAVDVTQPYHKRRRYMFRISDVEKVVNRRQPPPAPDAP